MKPTLLSQTSVISHLFSVPLEVRRGVATCAHGRTCVPERVENKK